MNYFLHLHVYLARNKRSCQVKQHKDKWRTNAVDSRTDSDAELSISHDLLHSCHIKVLAASIRQTTKVFHSKLWVPSRTQGPLSKLCSQVRMSAIH